MKKNKQGLIKLLIGIAVLALTFLYSKFFPTENKTLIIVNTVLKLILIGIGIKFIFDAMSLFANKVTTSKNIGDTVLKEWSMEELFDFLKKEQEIIDLTIENDGHLHVGVTTDQEFRRFYTRKKPYTKYYYIGDYRLDENVYVDFEAFRSAFLKIFKKETVIIYFAGIDDMPVEIE